MDKRRLVASGLVAGSAMLALAGCSEGDRVPVVLQNQCGFGVLAYVETDLEATGYIKIGEFEYIAVGAPGAVRELGGGTTVEIIVVSNSLEPKSTTSEYTVPEVAREGETPTDVVALSGARCPDGN